MRIIEQIGKNTLDNGIDILLSIRFDDDRDRKYDVEHGFVSVFVTNNDVDNATISLCDGGHLSNEKPFTELETNNIKKYVKEKSFNKLSNEELDKRIAHLEDVKIKATDVRAIEMADDAIEYLKTLKEENADVR